MKKISAKILLGLLIILPINCLAFSGCYEVIVNVNKTKPEDKEPWDNSILGHPEKAAPDVKACFEDEQGYRCKEKNKENRYIKPQRPNRKRGMYSR